MAQGPWTIAGDAAGTNNDLTWEQAYAQEVAPRVASSCGAGRMVGSIPDTLFAGQTAVTSFAWGDVAGWTDVKVNTCYKAESGYKIYSSADALTAKYAQDGNTFCYSWTEGAVQLTALLACTIATILAF